MRHWSLRILVASIALVSVAYVGDWVGLQLRERSGSGHGTVIVDNTDAIKEKGGKVEYFFNPPQPTPCVRALFPHEGQAACWWLARHSDQQIFMN